MTSREVDSIIGYVKARVPDAVVTATVGRYVSPQNPCAPHSPGSYHCKEGTGGAGLAVDFGGTPAQQLAAYRALEPVATQLAELIHNAPGISRAVKNGQWVNPLVVYGPVVWAAHTNHCHVAVNVETFLAPPPVPPMGAASRPTTPTNDIIHDFEEATIKNMLMHIGALDSNGNGYADWDPGLGRDPIIVGVTQLGPSPPDDNGYWPGQAHVNLSAQPRGGKVRVVVRNGTPADTVSCWVSVA